MGESLNVDRRVVIISQKKTGTQNLFRDTKLVSFSLNNKDIKSEVPPLVLSEKKS